MILSRPLQGNQNLKIEKNFKVNLEVAVNTVTGVIIKSVL